MTDNHDKRTPDLLVPVEQAQAMQQDLNTATLRAIRRRLTAIGINDDEDNDDGINGADAVDLLQEISDLLDLAGFTRD